MESQRDAAAGHGTRGTTAEWRSHGVPTFCFTMMAMPSSSLTVIWSAACMTPAGVRRAPARGVVRHRANEHARLVPAHNVPVPNRAAWCDHKPECSCCECGAAAALTSVWLLQDALHGLAVFPSASVAVGRRRAMRAATLARAPALAAAAARPSASGRRERRAARDAHPLTCSSMPRTFATAVYINALYLWQVREAV